MSRNNCYNLLYDSISTLQCCEIIWAPSSLQCCFTSLRFTIRFMYRPLRGLRVQMCLDFEPLRCPFYCRFPDVFGTFVLGQISAVDQMDSHLSPEYFIEQEAFKVRSTTARRPGSVATKQAQILYSCTDTWYIYAAIPRLVSSPCAAMHLAQTSVF